MPVVAGPEICVAATKSYTGQITALYLIALAFAGESLHGENVKKLAHMTDLCNEVLKRIDTYSLAHMCAQSSGVYFLGRDVDYAVALEGSLKLK